ncbi:hypothetical protein SmJEL517_g02949 [Synchytrium microbalum]|uniref:RING-type domain-containing protein n=1 Tax=Synchytrium microbalum TaxID=1806994 RepID=A0A507BYF9_9FUNG|nr:uncharacterized protein SmJEL517_g02949 [Synchytrium microbalum]TPX34340.1 hypothetical protein SmJEL517_g02949 [Synchytrium microbalum]
MSQSSSPPTLSAQGPLYVAASSLANDTSSPSAMSGEYEYVDTVNSNLVCCICYAPFTAPVSASCGHTYCKSCITQCLAATPEDSTPSCPIDRIPLTTNDLLPAVKIVTNMVDELVIYCIHKRTGCPWTGQRQHLNMHLNDECLCVRVKCELPACGKLVLRGDLEAHMKDCDYRTVECSLCKKSLSWINLESHRNECPAEAATCPYCQKELGRHELEAHSSSCPERQVPCLHARHGCIWQGRYQDRDTQHTLSCPYEAIKGFLVLQEQRNEELADENRDLKGQVALLRQELSELREAAVGPDHLQQALGPPPILDPPTLEHLNQIVAENEILRNDMEAMTQTIASVELNQNMALLSESNRLREEMQSVRAMCQAVQMQLVYSLDRRKDGAGPSAAANVIGAVAKALGPVGGPSPVVVGAGGVQIPLASPSLDEAKLSDMAIATPRQKWVRSSSSDERLNTSPTASQQNTITKL